MKVIFNVLLVLLIFVVCLPDAIAAKRKFRRMPLSTGLSRYDEVPLKTPPEVLHLVRLLAYDVSGDIIPKDAVWVPYLDEKDSLICSFTTVEDSDLDPKYRSPLQDVAESVKNSFGRRFFIRYWENGSRRKYYYEYFGLDAFLEDCGLDLEHPRIQCKQLDEATIPKNVKWHQDTIRGAFSVAVVSERDLSPEYQSQSFRDYEFHSAIKLQDDAFKARREALQNDFNKAVLALKKEHAHDMANLQSLIEEATSLNESPRSEDIAERVDAFLVRLSTYLKESGRSAQVENVESKRTMQRLEMLRHAHVK